MRNLISLFFIFYFSICFPQAFNKKTIIVNTNIGIPHLYKGIVKVATETDVFKKQFSGRLEVKDFKGLNPVMFKAEYGISKYFGLGISCAYWNMSFNISDFYNLIKAGQLIGSDQIDTYKFKVTSTSFGIRPNLHIPFKNDKNDLFLGVALGLTKNKLGIDFSSTDVNKVFPNLNYDLSLPGGFYFAPTLGYRHYFNQYAGMNLEIGLEKGAVIQAGIVVRIN
jgi:hypothetical protein